MANDLRAAEVTNWLVRSVSGIQYAAVLDERREILGEAGVADDGVVIEACHRAAAAAFALSGDDRVVDLPIDDLLSVFGVRIPSSMVIVVVYFDVEQLRAVLPQALSAATKRLLIAPKEIPPADDGGNSPPPARAFVVKRKPDED